MRHSPFIIPQPAKSQAYQPPTSRSARVWFFDLDNTIHDASHAVFAEIARGMVDTVQRHLQLDAEAARELCHRYWQRFGATMIGLHRFHGMDAEQFLLESHGPQLGDLVKFEHHLPALLDKVPGHKYILTNAPHHYAVQVLERLNITPYFRGICGVNQMKSLGQYRPKPSVPFLQQLQASLGLDPAQCVLVEDTLPNLKAAKQVGWQTVYIYHPHTPFGLEQRVRPSYVDLRVRSLSELLRHPFAQA